MNSKMSRSQLSWILDFHTPKGTKKLRRPSLTFQFDQMRETHATFGSFSWGITWWLFKLNFLLFQPVRMLRIFAHMFLRADWIYFKYKISSLHNLGRWLRGRAPKWGVDRVSTNSSIFFSDFFLTFFVFEKFTHKSLRIIFKFQI